MVETVVCAALKGHKGQPVPHSSIVRGWQLCSEVDLLAPAGTEPYLCRWVPSFLPARLSVNYLQASRLRASLLSSDTPSRCLQAVCPQSGRKLRNSQNAQPCCRQMASRSCLS